MPAREVAETVHPQANELGPLLLMTQHNLVAPLPSRSTVEKGQ